MSMFPHTVTLYNVSVETDPATLEERTINHITVLEGVLLDAVKGKNVNESGLVDADSVTLYIPANASATDGVPARRSVTLDPWSFGTARAGTGCGPYLPARTPFSSRGRPSTRTGAARRYQPPMTTSMT